MAWTVYVPGGICLISKNPSLSVTAEMAGPCGGKTTIVALPMAAPEGSKTCPLSERDGACANRLPLAKSKQIQAANRVGDLMLNECGVIEAPEPFCVRVIEVCRLRQQLPHHRRRGSRAKESFPGRLSAKPEGWFDAAEQSDGRHAGP